MQLYSLQKLQTENYINRNWGKKLQNEEDTNQEEIVQPKKRGRKPKATI